MIQSRVLVRLIIATQNNIKVTALFIPPLGRFVTFLILFYYPRVPSLVLHRSLQVYFSI